MLELKNVHGGYGKVTILNGVSFTIPKASITTVIGQTARASRPSSRRSSAFSTSIPARLFWMERT